MSEELYASADLVREIVDALERLKDAHHRISHAKLAERCHCSPSKMDKMLQVKEEKLYVGDEEIGGEMMPIYYTYDAVSYPMTMEEYDEIEVYLNPLLEAEGFPHFHPHDSAQRRKVRDTARASLDYIIDLLSDDARDMHDLEACAWELYRKRYPRRPVFCEYSAPDIWDLGFTRPGSAVWDTATDAERQAWADCWKQARAKADAQVERHVEAERLHRAAEDAAVIDPAEPPQNAWTGIQERRADLRLTNNFSSRRWLQACPPGEGYERDRRRIELELRRQSLEKERQMIDEDLAEVDSKLAEEDA